MCFNKNFHEQVFTNSSDSSNYYRQQGNYELSRKGNFLNNSFALQCMPIVNDSILLSKIKYKTENRFSTISFKDEDVLKIIKFT